MFELNYYLCDHSDRTAESIGGILEDMGIFCFSSSVIREMNLHGAGEERINSISEIYKREKNKGIRINIVLFLTKYFSRKKEMFEELNEIRRVCFDTDIKLFAVIDDEMRRYFNKHDEYFRWIARHTRIFFVSEIYEKADAMEVARELTKELMIQRTDAVRGQGSTAMMLSDSNYVWPQHDEYIDSMTEVYRTIPEEDHPGKFLMIFSLFKYCGRNHTDTLYGKCMDYLMNRRMNDLIFAKKDLELAGVCLVSEITHFLLRQ